MRPSNDIAQRASWPGGSRLGGLILCAALSQPAHALQVLDARDGVAIEAILSIKEPTRIRIEGAPITDVFGNIHSSSCGASNAAATPAGIVTPAANPGGEIVLECDRDKGEIYIRPGRDDSAKPVNLFISSAQATYTLVLRRSDTPADTIVIRGVADASAIRAWSSANPSRHDRTSGVRPVRQPRPCDEGDAGGDGLGPGATPTSASTRSTSRCSSGPKRGSR
jgi:conjugal transfer pilus assembly protein TraK